MELDVLIGEQDTEARTPDGTSSASSDALPEVSGAAWTAATEGEMAGAMIGLSNPPLSSAIEYCIDVDSTSCLDPFDLFTCDCETTNRLWTFCQDVDGDGYHRTCVSGVVQYNEKEECSLFSIFGACIGVIETVRDGETTAFQSYWNSTQWGQSLGQDCTPARDNPGQWNIHPGRQERCDDGVSDNNCDGVDPFGNLGGSCSGFVSPPEGGGCTQAGSYVCSGGTSLSCQLNTRPARTFYRDADLDGFGDSTVPSISWIYDCNPAFGWSLTAGDCNDGNNTVYPGATELCDTVDNNCNGLNNEGIVVATCGTGLPGECASGTTTCSDVGPGPCVPDRTPGTVAETCSNFGTDDDCDGQLDNIPGIGVACDTGDGDICDDGLTRCGGGGAVECYQTGPIAAYDFVVDQGTTTLDTSGNGNSGFLAASFLPSTFQSTWTSEGYTGGGIEMRGTGNWNQIGSEFRVTPGAEFSNDRGSVEMWVRPDFDGANNAAYGWFQTGPTYNSANWISAFKWYNVFYFRMGRNGSCCSNDLTFNDDGLIRRDQWSHWVFTWDQDTGLMRVYVNGVRVAQRSANFNNGNVLNDLRIGRGHQASFDGQMDDIAVYSYALSQDQVSARFAAGSLTPRFGSGNDPGGQNADLCDLVDNDCTAATVDGADDPRVGLTNVCDSPDDNDACTDDFFVCGATGIECANSTVNDANQVEVCDGIDNDCRNGIDDGVTPTFYRDADGDGFGDPNVTRSVPGECTPQAGWVDNTLDCEDDPALGGATIRPGATEVCDGVDNNCDDVIDEEPPTGWGSCSLDYPTTQCRDGGSVCQDGALVCWPNVPTAGQIETVNVTGELIARDSALVEEDWSIMTADARYAYALAYANPDNGPGAYNGWTYRVYDPRDNWSLVREVRTGTSSYYTDGLISDGNYLYPLEWTGGANQRAYRIRIADGTVEDLGYTYPAQFITGQYEPNTETVYLSTLRFGAQFRTYDASNGWQPPALATGTVNIDPVIGTGMGTLGTDGTYIYGIRWHSSYPGPTRLARIGTGNNGTTPGAFYGYMTTGAIDATLGGFVFDGYFYASGRDDNTLQRVRISEAVAEVCGGGDEDCDGLSNEPGGVGCIEYYYDFDDDTYGVLGDSQCLCAPQGHYTATRTDAFDCDDTDSGINPGAVEAVGDGEDSNCDALEVCYVDDDRDFYHAGDTLITAELSCPTSSGLADNGTPGGDCNDDDPSIFPTAPEPCDYVDNDCDGTIDDNHPLVGTTCDPTFGASCEDSYYVCNATGTNVACGEPPVAVYDFDDGSGGIATDAATPTLAGTPTNDLQFVNGAEFSSTARSGSSVTFDGIDDYARGTEWGAWSALSEYSVSAWIRPTRLAGTRYIAASQGVGFSVSGWRWRLYLQDGVPTFEHFDGDNSTTSAATSVTPNAWTHVAVSVTVGGEAQLYVNGAPVGTPSTVTANGSFGYPTVGAQTFNNTITHVFEGQIDEFGLFPLALTAAQVADLNTSGDLPARFVTFEFCDSLDNDCSGTADDFAAYATVGDACDGGDLDTCVDANVECNSRRDGVACRMSGPLAFFSFDGPAGTTLYNAAGAAYGQTGDGQYNDVAMRGAAYRGDGIDVDGSITRFASVPDSPLTDVGLGEITLAAWVNTDNYLPGNRIIASKEGAYQMAIAPGSALACAVHTNTQPAFWLYGGSVPRREWHHVACTFDSDGFVRHYVDGVLVATSAFIGGQVENSSAPLLIGRRNGGAAYDGIIDELGVWERALSQTEIADVMNNGVAATYGGLNQRGDNREICDGADNNCNGVDDEIFVYEDPQGNFSGIGQGCDGNDSDWCDDEGGVVSCSPDRYGVSCSDDDTDNDVEVCDGLDNDCRFGPDDQLVFINYYPDEDRDNFGDANRVVNACEPPAGSWVTNGFDCSDVNGAVRPGGAEVCDGFDNDCDGTVDDGPLPGEGGSCTAAAIGRCADGTQACSGSTFYAPASSMVHGDGFLADWLVVGPYYWSPATGTPCNELPTNTIDPTTMPVAGDTFSQNGLDYPWFAHSGLTGVSGACNGGWGVDLDTFHLLHPPFSSNVTFSYVYTSTYVHSPGSRLVDLAIGVDDAARIYLNGALVWQGNTCDCADTDEILIEDLTLNEGQNVLLMQIANVTAEAGWVARFLHPDDGTVIDDVRTTLEPAGTIECQPGTPLPEIPCNGLDDDCSGAPLDQETDLDGDGQWECLGDCAPNDGSIYLGAPETCDYRDEDCDGMVDDGLNVGTFCEDSVDADACLDGKILCDDTLGGAYCSRGAGALLTFEAPSRMGLDLSGEGDAVVDGPVHSGTFYRNGLGGALFSGSTDAIRIPELQAESPEFTFAAWVNPSAAGPRAIVSTIDGGANGLLLGTQDWLHFQGVVYPPLPALPLGAWTHVAVTYDRRELTVYHDGMVVSGPHASAPSAMNSAFGPAHNLDSDVWVGAELDFLSSATRPGCPTGCTIDPNQNFLGAMDDVAWYRHPLTQMEIQDLMLSIPDLDRNLELCDARDNDCDMAFDEDYVLSAACNGADNDDCDDALTVCSADALGTECAFGAATLLNFDVLETAAGQDRAVDLSGNDNDALLGADATIESAAGRTGLVLDAQSDSYAIIDLDEASRSSFTFSALVRSPNTSLSSRVIAHRMTAYEQANGCTGGGFSIADNGEMQFQCQLFRIPDFATDLHLPSRPWVALTVVYDGVNLQVYVGGVPADIEFFSGLFWVPAGTSVSMATIPQITWTSDLVLGQRMTVPNGGFSPAFGWEGWIDQVAWFDHVPAPSYLTPLTTGLFDDEIVNYELCDGEDNNCRAGADEIHTDLGDACTGGTGGCVDTGTLVCADHGVGTACSTDGIEPTAEVCDATDNDCDGVIDNFTQFCATSCGIGRQVCTAGVWSDCDVTPEPEVCDGFDNDCDLSLADDGEAEPNYGLACDGPDSDLCENGVWICDGVNGMICGPETVTDIVEVCNYVDDDCDTSIDEGFPDLGNACTIGVGACEATGVIECTADGSGTECSGTPGTPTAEVCGDGIDNNCDGTIDEGSIDATLEVLEVAIGSTTFDYGRCDSGQGNAPRCAAVVFRVTNNSALPLPASALVEIVADDGSATTTVSTGGTLGREVAAGPNTQEEFVFCWENLNEIEDVTLEVSLAETCVDVRGTSPSAVDLGLCSDTEICDAIDNNINGTVNELPEACGGDPTLICLNDEAFDNWVCVRGLEGESCEETGCPVGETCTDGVCEPGCSRDGQCPSGTVCELGECVAELASVETDEVEDAGIPEGTGNAASDESPRAGCAAAATGGAGLWWALALVALRRRRRR